MKLLSGNSNRALSQAIAAHLDAPLTKAQVKRFAEMAGAEFPADLAERLVAASDDPAEVRRIGVEVATELCQELLDAGVPGLHFYSLFRATATPEIYANLGLTAAS